MKPSNTLYIMPTGDAKIIGEKNGYYIVKFDSGEEIYFPKDFIDNIPEDEHD